jgi:outer membrane protein assembly factor BamB
VNLSTLSPEWSIDVNDDTDSTVVLEREQNGLNLYTACEVDHQGAGGFSYVRKIDGASGKILWENKYKCGFVDETNGGALATPVLGKGEISNLVIFNIARTPTTGASILVAIDKESGKEKWKLDLPNYCWSSPLALYTKDGKSYIVQCDSVGKAMLIEGISGRILDKIDLGANVEGSPSAFENNLVVGTRGGKIIGFEVK